MLEAIAKTDSSDIELLRNGSIFLYHYLHEENEENQGFKKKLEAVEALNKFKEPKYFSENYCLADLKEEFQFSSELEPSEIPTQD